MYPEDELLPISALQHLEFCRRRCALIHIEGMWAENTLTAQGNVLHRRVHEATAERIGDVRVARGLRLCSRTLGLFGVADVVEFHPVAESAGGAELPGVPGRWKPLPVEYKRGRRKSEKSYFIQLCAQALCLEEMLASAVPIGALYHGQSRRRQPVEFTEVLRQQTRQRADELHALIASGRSPPPEPGPKCRFCSLAGKCLPKLPATRSARRYLASTIDRLLAESPDEETR